MMLGWRAWYTRGRVFSSQDTPWPELPPKGMLGVVVYLENGYREIIQTCDWWWMDSDGVIYGVPTHPKWGRWAEKPEASEVVIKRGEGIEDSAWASIQDEMMEARQWP